MLEKWQKSIPEIFVDIQTLNSMNILDTKNGTFSYLPIVKSPSLPQTYALSFDSLISDSSATLLTYVPRKVRLLKEEQSLQKYLFYFKNIA